MNRGNYDRQPAAAASSAIPKSGIFTFSLSKLLLFIALASLLCGVTVWRFDLGCVLALLSLPAVVRTAIVVRHQPAQPSGSPLWNSSATFAKSFAWVLIIMFAAAGFFIGPCWLSANFANAVKTADAADSSFPSIFIGMVSGGILATYMACLIFTNRATLGLTNEQLSSNEKACLYVSIILCVVGAPAALSMIAMLRDATDGMQIFQ